MRGIALAGVIALAFGVGAYYATGHLGAFSVANLVLGASALLVAIASGARHLRSAGGPHARRVIARGLLLIAGAVAIAVFMERAAARSGVRLDWTGEGRYELADATREAVSRMCGPLEILLFHDPLDPRIRRTRLLLTTLARHGEATLREYDIEDSPEVVDIYGIGSSNSVVLRTSDRDEVVERPTEGAIYEALYRLCAPRFGAIALLRGEGEGDPERGDDLGFSGLATALATEGYAVRSLVTSALRDVPEDVDAVLVIAPQRALQTEALESLRRYLARGGRLVALLEPGVASGVETLLAEYGLASPDSVLIDPASGSLGSKAAGLCPVAYSYEHHPVTAGLDRNRMTFFCGVRSFVLRKPEVEDALRAVVQASPRSWLSHDLGVLERREAPVRPDRARQTYHPIAVAGSYLRDGVETRILAVGDSDFASNRFLRSLYNLDLILNGVHWVAAREPAITLRPKIRPTVQFPLPVTDSLETLYGVGLLVPELLLIAGAIVWLRRRAA
jgi:hypothetical protein